MLYYLHQLEYLWGPFRLFRYVTFRGAMALLTSLAWGLIIGPKIFSFLRQIKAKDIGRDASIVGDLAALHASKKQIPTMGGIAILTGVFLSCLLWLKPNIYSYSALFAGIVMGLTGMIDDGLKLKRKNSRGLSGCWKIILQEIITIAILCLMVGMPESNPFIYHLYLPFCKIPLWTTLPTVVLFLYWFLVISGTSNALNLTDGIDGLATICSITVLFTYAIFTYVTSHIVFAHYLHLPFLPGVEELTVLCLAIAGAAIAFLWFNTYPAEIFMGDTGSLAIGAWIGCIALMSHQAFTLVIVGFVFVIEALSVILQVTSFKFFHRRIFKMSPLHHHFELSHIPESKIVIRFWIVSLLCALLGLMSLKLR